MEEGMDIPGYTFPAASTALSINETTGDILWDAPISQGEYNIAIAVEEWRYGRKIGEITRDMQITVQQCDNRSPVLTVQNHCVVAGDTFTTSIKAYDPDSTRVEITATGELFMLPDTDIRPSLTVLDDGTNSGYATTLFSWRVPYSTPRKDPYTVYCKATDYGVPRLSDLKNFTITVVAPSPTITLLQADGRGNPQLYYTQSPVPHVVGYNIYRHNGTSTPTQDSCSGGLPDDAFTLIATTQDAFYTDTSFLQNGMTYCYRVTAVMQDNSESLFSNEECFTVRQTGVPVFTHTSIEKTHPYQGVVKVRWMMLPDDTGGEYGNRQFTLYRVEVGETGDTVKPVRIFPFDTAITFYDSLRNTEEHIQRYIVAFGDTAIPTQQEQTSTSPTLRLQAFPYSHKVVLRWQDHQLWYNRYYRIYRASATNPAEPLQQIARVADILYVDTAVANDSTYIYCIEGEGTYFNGQIESPLLNRSNETQAMPQVQPPCEPQLISVENRCEPYQNTLQWTIDCDPENTEDIVRYDIYSAPAGDTNYTFALSVTNTAANTVVDESPAFYRLCYVMTAVNSKGQESGYSNSVCIDNRSCFKLNLPNVFTPNGDNINDVFRPKEAQHAENFEIQIFDRWGRLVFKTKDFPFEWNGCYMDSNNACPDGAYFYVIEFSIPDEGIPQKQIQSGSVVILRQ
jgi:gliding motility-associated-like protein